MLEGWELFSLNFIFNLDCFALRISTKLNHTACEQNYKQIQNQKRIIFLFEFKNSTSPSVFCLHHTPPPLSIRIFHFSHQRIESSHFYYSNYLHWWKLIISVSKRQRNFLGVFTWCGKMRGKKKKVRRQLRKGVHEYEEISVSWAKDNIFMICLHSLRRSL